MRRPPHLPVSPRLVEKQIRRRDLAERARFEPRSVEPSIRDFVCISRSVGLDSRNVGVLLGKALGWPVFDREVLHVMSEGDPAKLRHYEWLDERDLTWLQDVALGLGSSQYTWHEYSHRLTETVLSIARQADSIFVGRGTDLILPRDRGLRVRLHARAETILTSFALDHGLPVDEARREIEARVEHRRRYFQSNFRADPDDLDRHDLVVSLDRYSEEEVVEVMLAARRLLPSRAED